VFDDALGVVAGDDAGGSRSRWSRLWERVWPAAVVLFVVSAVVLMLIVAVRLALPSLPTAAARPAPTKPHGKAAPPAPAPVALVAVRTGGVPLKERAGPSNYYAVRGSIADRGTVGVLCQVYGQSLDGTVTTSAMWEVDVNGRYISDAWIEWSPERPDIPWCGVSTRRAVTATASVGGDGLTVRAGPSTGNKKVGTVPAGTTLNVTCRAWGQSVDGTEDHTASWSKLDDGGYVSDAYIAWAPEQPFIPWCGEAPQSVPPATMAEFIAAAVKPAQAGMKLYDVPASVTIAQAILESGIGVSTLTRVDHSLFGMKCFGNPGPVAVGCRDYATHECNPNGHCYATHASFRAYRSEADSYTDHGLMLSTLSRYDPAFSYTFQPDKFAQALQKGGYATSKSYAKNLIALMKKYNLYRYDLKPPKPTLTPV